MSEKFADLPNYSYLLDYYHEYSNPKMKIVQQCKKGELIKLKQGLYLSWNALDAGIPMGLIANCLYGPSYVSFAYALRMYSMIPEDVPNPTSATFSKRRRKRYDTSICSFFYRDVPVAAYQLEIVYVQSGKWRYLAASKEKALCDELSTIPGIRSKKTLHSLLFEDLRIDENIFESLDFPVLKRLAPLYRSTTLDAFLDLIGG